MVNLMLKLVLSWPVLEDGEGRKGGIYTHMRSRAELATDYTNPHYSIASERLIILGKVRFICPYYFEPLALYFGAMVEMQFAEAH
jgi:hypothetical protein